MALALEYEDAAGRAALVSSETLDTTLAYLCSEAHRQRIFFL